MKLNKNTLALGISMVMAGGGSQLALAQQNEQGAGSQEKANLLEEVVSITSNYMQPILLMRNMRSSELGGRWAIGFPQHSRGPTD